MKVLGVHDGHTATAALLENGEIKAAISEERINRIKEWQGLPKGAIKKLLDITKTSPEEIDLVVFPSIIQQAERDQFIEEKHSITVEGFNLFKKIFPKNFVKDNLWTNPAIKFCSLFRKKEEIFSFFKQIGISKEKIIFAEHHLCHAFSALSNPWGLNDDALILTIDGAGDGFSSTVNILRKGEIITVEKTNLYNSLGFLYSAATNFLNMRPLSHEYKLMGLAAYAKEENYKEVYEKLKKDYMRINPKNNLRFENLSGCTTKDYIRKFKKDFGDVRFDNFAGGIQKFTEDIILEFVKNCIKKTGIKNVFCSGGVFMNVKANMRIMYEAGVDKFFVFPSCADESNSIGACNYGYYVLCKKNNKPAVYKKISSIYFGEEHSNEEILKEISGYRDKIKFSYKADIDKYVAQQLAKKLIIARFSGRMEFGARALGNRSILAHPGFKDSVREINEAIKMRDFWMPFAGTILDLDENKYLVNPLKVLSPHMLIGFKTKKKAVEEIFSAIHQYDLTCRPQILKKEYNRGYYNLIKNFRSITGVGAVLNTSFNIHGEPLVASPKDAIETLLKSGLKYLAIGNYYVEKK